MSFKRLDPEDVVLSSELVTTPTWYTQEGGDTATIVPKNDLTPAPVAGQSALYYEDFYSKYSASGASSASFDEEHSKCMMSVALAVRPPSGSYDPERDGANPSASFIVFGQYRSLVLGDEDSEFRFGSTQASVAEGEVPYCSKFFAISVDRARFREKIDPTTCRIKIGGITLAPDTTANERYLDSGRVYDLAKFDQNVSGGVTQSSFSYPMNGSAATSFGYFLPDIGVILLNADSGLKYYRTGSSGATSSFVAVSNAAAAGGSITPAESLVSALDEFTLRSQETITSNFVFARARNAEFNYSTNPSNITGSAGNIRWGVMINQPQTFITTIGLYNDSNELLAVGKLSKPLVKDFTREALIRLKLDY